MSAACMPMMKPMSSEFFQINVSGRLQGIPARRNCERRVYLSFTFTNTLAP